MTTTQKVKINKTGEEGYIMYLDHSPITERNYHVRFKGNGGGYVGRSLKGSEFTVLN